MLAGKVTAFLLTQSAAIFSDAAESMVHVVAVAFAALSLRLSARAAGPRFLYGFERISFFSAGLEEAMIIVSALAILFESIRRWMAGLELQNLGSGALLILSAGIINVALGYYLLRVGRRTDSLILEADGKHVLVDSLTSFGVMAGLGLVLLTGWKPFDPLVAIAVAVNILWSGARLVWRSAMGLLDYSDLDAGRKIKTNWTRSVRSWRFSTMACVSGPPAIARSSKCTCCFPTRPQLVKHMARRPFWRNGWRRSWECPPRW